MPVIPFGQRPLDLENLQDTRKVCRRMYVLQDVMLPMCRVALVQ